MPEEDIVVARAVPKHIRDARATIPKPSRGYEFAASIPLMVEGDGKEPEPTLDIYEKVKGHPYSVDYFGIENYGELDIDVGAVKEKVKRIESFVKEEIEKRFYTKSLDSYKEIVGEIKDFLGIKRNEEMFSILTKVSKYVDLLSKQRRLEDRKQKILMSWKERNML